MSLSTHVLDTSIGRPAAGIGVRLERLEGGSWIELSSAATNDDGRVAALLPADAPVSPGVFRLAFDAAAYFASRAQDTFYTTITIEFLVRDGAQHYHVPLLLSPFGYSTYRGS
jgi:5-hydroxyisourate hydrolase